MVSTSLELKCKEAGKPEILVISRTAHIARHGWPVYLLEHDERLGLHAAPLGGHGGFRGSDFFLTPTAAQVTTST